MDESDRLALDHIDLAEAKLLRHPDNYRVRSHLATAYGFVGDLARMRSEEDIIRGSIGGVALGDLALGEGSVGEQKHFVELRTALLKSGTVGHIYSNLRALHADPKLEDYPGSKEFAAGEALEFETLRR